MITEKNKCISHVVTSGSANCYSPNVSKQKGKAEVKSPCQHNEGKLGQ